MAKHNVTNPSGFLEFSPLQERVRQEWIRVITEVFEKNGFPRIDTPLVERAENFVAKDGNPKEIYILDRLLRDEAIDQDKDQRAIRFDHTVPMALYVARHFNDISFPFRRSVIGPVMRGERAQKGRFRQFDQCDIDVIGSEHLSLLNDAQMPAIIIEIFEKLLPGQDFVVRINNRKILTGFFRELDVTPEQFKDVLHIVDDLEKHGEAKVTAELKAFGMSDKNIEKLFQFVEVKGSDEEILQLLEELTGNEVFREGVAELRETREALESMAIHPKRIQIDLSIARGLDYYTGTVYETNLLNKDGTKNTSLGSICSGGRYDDLASIFTNKKLPGVGISIGLTRLLWQLFDAKILEPKRATSTQVLILTMDESATKTALETGARLRKKGLSVENYFEKKKIQKQFAYADKLGIPYCLVLGENEVSNGTITIKDMVNGTQETVKNDEKLVSLLK